MLFKPIEFLRPSRHCAGVGRSRSRGSSGREQGKKGGSIYVSFIYAFAWR